jgi:tetratricopeptide (TPR) repeat protein
MKNAVIAVLLTGSLLLSASIVFASKEKPLGIDTIRGKSAQDAAAAALIEAEKLAGTGSWELLGIARVYYLSGNRSKGQEIIDRVLAHKSDRSDWQRIGQIYADAGENDKAAQYFERALAADAKDDTGQAEIGAWYIRIGQREKGEALLAKALARNPEEVWHYLNAAEAFLNVPPGK